MWSEVTMMTKSTVSPEMTFIPAKAPHEIVSEKVGRELVKRINDYLDEVGRASGAWMLAKLDPLHNWVAPREDLKDTWSIEIVPGDSLLMYWFTDPKEWRKLRVVFDRFLFKVLRDKFALIPLLVERRKGRHRYWPNGGCHIHRSIDMFPESSLWYKHMATFHCNLLADFANRPYIRWLFSAPFSDRHADVLVDRHAIEGGWSKVGEDGSQFLPGNNSIRARFMEGTKTLYPTFEFRLFSMVADADELRAIVLFTDRWVRYWAARSSPHMSPLLFELDMARWNHITSEKGAREGVRETLKLLDLDPKPYNVFVQRNLLPRLRYGKLV